jgi:hypothetical protein
LIASNTILIGFPLGMFYTTQDVEAARTFENIDQILLSASLNATFTL